MCEGEGILHACTAQASGNVAGLCNWAEAMCTYHEVAKEVDPKITALRAAEEELRVATKQRDAALDQLALVQGRLDAMQVRGPVGLRCSPITCGCYDSRSVLCSV